jgi:uncharacterized membrane protein
MQWQQTIEPLLEMSIPTTLVVGVVSVPGVMRSMQNSTMTMMVMTTMTMMMMMITLMVMMASTATRRRRQQQQCRCPRGTTQPAPMLMSD